MASLTLYATDHRTLRQHGARRQHWRVWLLVADVERARAVKLVWQAQGGDWQTLEAQYLGSRLDGQGFWLVEWQGEPQGDVQFAACLQSEQGECWNNAGGHNHPLAVNSGLQLFQSQALQMLPVGEMLSAEQRHLTLDIAVPRGMPVEQLYIHWTTNGWQRSRQQLCKPLRSEANDQGWQLWQARLNIGKAYRVDYCAALYSAGQQIWANNYGANYHAQRRPFKLLILNLHCYQEDNQEFKLQQIARAIEEQAIDVVCFQEVAEPWNDGQGDWQANAAQRINQYLPQSMHIYSDWSHQGFERYREGLAILSCYPFKQCEARYVSDSDQIYDIHSRKVLRSLIDVPHYGLINLFCVHLSWWESGFARQWQRLADWAKHSRVRNQQATLIAGDFNIRSDSPAYQLVLADGFQDQYLAAPQQQADARHWTVNDSHWHYQPGNDSRIDFVFADAKSRLSAQTAQSLFTEADYGRVSDHCGFLLSFERA